MGNFDGLHRGHHRLLARLRQRAREQGRPAVVVSFQPHPLAVLRPESAPSPLLWPERKKELLLSAGADAVVLYRSTRELLALSAEQFFVQVLLGRLEARGLVEGPNFGFGRGRSGNVDLLGQLCQQHGLGLDVVELVGGNEDVSSTAVRNRIRAGDVAGARRLLGRPHRLSGTVVVGECRGRRLGFPTANLAEIPVLLPADGVYAVWAWVEGRALPGACHIGPNPTFGQPGRKVEIHLLDFSRDLYGTTLDVELLDRIRDIQRFSNPQDLTDQLRRDIAIVKEVVANDPPDVDTRRTVLAQTIGEWLRDQVEPTVAPLGARLTRVTLDALDRLEIEWSWPRRLPPAELFEVLMRTEPRVRQVFPEVARVVPRADIPPGG